MTVRTTTHLNFRGDARAALEFYHSIFGGQQMVVSYNDAGAVHDPAEADQVMWGQVAAENGFCVMAYDVPSRLSWSPGEIPFFVSLRGDVAYEITSSWEKLAEGSTIIQPLAPSGCRRSTACSRTASASPGSWTLPKALAPCPDRRSTSVQGSLAPAHSCLAGRTWIGPTFCGHRIDSGRRACRTCRRFSVRPGAAGPDQAARPCRSAPAGRNSSPAAAPYPLAEERARSSVCRVR